MDKLKTEHTEVSVENGRDVDLTHSCYLALSWNREGWYQLYQFDLELPAPNNLKWYFPTYTRNGLTQIGNHLNGDDGLGRVFEWYGESGGQLKY